MLDIMAVCEKHKDDFQRAISDSGFEAKGIFNSEMLMFVSVARELGVGRIIESGRARGQSTLVLCRCFREPVAIASVELRRYTRDSLIAMKRLRGCRNISLHFGDAGRVVPGLVSETCCVLIDGPKGDGALALAADVLRRPEVAAVFVHDVHKDSPHRKVMEEIFRYTAFSDDPAFVQRFQHLDEACWREQAIERPGWEPYRRGSLRMQSYSATLGVAFNGDSAIDEAALHDYFANVASRERLRTRFARAVRANLSKVSAPLWFVPYHLERVRR